MTATSISLNSVDRRTVRLRISRICETAANTKLVLSPAVFGTETRWSVAAGSGAGNHGSGDLVIPGNVTLASLPAYSPELTPQEHIWDEIREKIFKNYAAKSIDEVCDMLVKAALYIESNPKMVKSMTSFPYIINAL